MKQKPDPLEILRNIADIDRMERGKLCIIRHGPNGPYFNLQRREGGRNVTEYVPPDQIPQVQTNIEAHDRFQSLVGEYETLITEQTRRERKAGIKKKPSPRKSPLPKKPKSKT